MARIEPGTPADQKNQSISGGGSVSETAQFDYDKKADAIALSLYDARLKAGEKTPELFFSLARVLCRTGKPLDALNVFKKLSSDLKRQLASDDHNKAAEVFFTKVIFATSEAYELLGDTSAAVQVLDEIKGSAGNAGLAKRLAELNSGNHQANGKAGFDKPGWAGCFDGIDESGRLAGWATRSDKPQGALNIYFFLDDRLVGSDCTRLNRPDLASVGHPTEKSGFSALPDLSVLAPGLRVGASLRAAFDARGRYALSRTLVLEESHIQRLLQANVDAVFAGEVHLTIEQATAKIRLLKAVGLGSSRLFRELMVGVLTSLLVEQKSDEVAHYFDRPDFSSITETLEPLLEFELVRCMAAVDLDNTSLISIDRLNAACGAYYGDEEFRKNGHRERQRIQKLLSALRLHLLFSFSFSKIEINEALQNTLCKTLSYWAHRLVGDSRLSLDFLDLLAIKNKLAPGTFSPQEVRLNNELGRGLLALGIAITAIRQGNASWYVHHQAGAVLRTILKLNPQYHGKFSSSVLGLFKEALALNPEQSLSLHESHAFVRAWFDAAMDATAKIAFQGNVAAASSLRESTLRAIGNELQRLYPVPVQSCNNNFACNDSDNTGSQSVSLLATHTGKKLLLLGSRGLFQCFYYRVQQKMDQAAALGIEYEYLDISALATPAWKDHLMNVGVVFACRVPATLEILYFFAYARSLGIKLVYDIDDLIFNPAFFPPSLASYAGTIDSDTHVHLAMDNPFFSEALAYADHCTTSTHALAEQLRAFVPAHAKITVLPNLMNGELQGLAQSDASPRKPSDRVVLFYGSATKAHKQVFYEVLLPAALYVLKKYDHVDLHLIGYFENLPLQWLQTGRIKLNQPTPGYMSYLQWVGQADINLAPLELSVLTDTKSEIKWLEAAVFGVPSVVSPTATYRGVLLENEHALFASTPEQWASQLESLVEDAALRQRLGGAAKAHALANYAPAVGEAILSGVLSSLAFPPARRGKKRLLFVNVFYAPQSIGGATRVVEAQVRGLIQNYGDAFEVHVLTSHSSPDADRPYSIDQFHIDGALVTRLHVPLKGWTEIEDEKVEAFCNNFFSQYEFDLLHLHSIQVLTASVVKAALSKKIPYVITLHDAWWLSPYMFLVDENSAVVDPKDLLSGGALTAQSSSKRLHRAHYLRHVMGNASALLAVSEKFAQVYRDAGVSNVAVHENVSQPFTVLPRVAQDADKTVLGFIGGMSPHKGYHLFKAALESGDFPHFKALVVDHGLEPGEPVYRARWGSTEVEFIPKIKQGEVAQLYARMDVLVAPSIWPESYGLVTREALHAGVWVIASDRGAIGDCIVEGVNGNRIPVENSLALSRVFEHLNERPFGQRCQAAVSAACNTEWRSEHLAWLMSVYQDL
jgi:glycosyltransferase involved in cell wall biosynthesis